MTPENCGSGLVAYTRRVEDSLVLVGPSVNKEISGVAELPAPDPDGFYFLVGGKNVVQSIDRSSFGEEGDERVEITSEGGEKITVIMKAGSYLRFPAGSSINMAFGFHYLGISDIGIVGPIGTGKTGNFLERAMIDRGLKLFLPPRQGTALTLTVRDPVTKRSTSFCEKPPYQVSEGILSELRRFNSRVAFATSVRPIDLMLANAILENAPTKVFVPNPDLIGSQLHRQDLTDLLSHSTIVQMNNDEAGALLGGGFNAENALERVKEFKAYGQNIIIVTLGEYGSVMFEKDGIPVLQPAFKVEARDQTGAGDIHLAAFVYYYCLRPQRPPINVCLAMAGWIAARKVATVGPWSGIPPKEERQAKLQELWPDYSKQ